MSNYELNDVIKNAKNNIQSASLYDGQWLVNQNLVRLIIAFFCNMFKTRITYDHFNIIQVCSGIYWSHLVYKQNIERKKNLFILHILFYIRALGLLSAIKEICPLSLTNKYIHKHKHPVYAPNKYTVYVCMYLFYT